MRFHLAILPDALIGPTSTGVPALSIGCALSELAADFRPYCADNQRLG
jgi:hypothetical protein